MADIIINPGKIEIGIPFTPNTTSHKYITLSNINITGQIDIPSATANLQIGNPEQIRSDTIINSTFAIVDSNSINVDQNENKLLFNVIVQTKYNTPTLQNQNFLDTKTCSAEASITFPPDMKDFVLDNSFIPYIESIGQSTIVETASESGNYIIEVPITTGAFTISATGTTNINIPLAIEEPIN